VWDVPGTRLFERPVLWDVQPFGELGRIEEPVGHDLESPVMSNYEIVYYDEDGREVQLASGELIQMGDIYDAGDTLMLNVEGVERPLKVARTEGTKIVVERPGD
jgi:hypothetical protein